MQGSSHRRTVPSISLLIVLALTAAQSPLASPESLEALARALREEKSDAAYARLAEFARKNAGNESGAQAALALGRADQDRKRLDPALGWYQQAEKSELLREYALLLGAQTARALAKEEQAISRLERLRRDFPSSVLTRVAVGELAGAALAVGQAEKALSAFHGYPQVASDSWLLLLRAKALQQLGRLEPAAADYAAIHYGFPLSNEAKTAEAMVASLRKTLGTKFPSVPLGQQVSRADTLFQRNRCTQARREYGQVLPKLSGHARERVLLRIARCRIRAGAPVSVLTGLKLTNANLNAERLYWLSQTYRARRQIKAMLNTVEGLVKRYPKSRWAEAALFATGNYYWVDLNRSEAAKYYRRAAGKGGRNAMAAHWRAAWTAYLERPGEAAALFEEHLTRFRNTPYAENALYWLGRLAERAGDVPRARAFYVRAMERYTQSYYGRQAAARLAAIGTGRTAPVPVLARIPAPAPAPPLDDSIPAAAEPYRLRARALLMLGLELYAEQELRAAHAATPSPRLLLEAAQAAHQASRHGVGIVIARRLDPYLDSRRVPEAPEEIWRAVYPFPFESDIVTRAEKRGLDPMLVAGLIRQESTFLADVVSRAGAVGLMQVMPSTGRVLARRERVPYSRRRLFDADYNLRLGISHLAELVNRYSSMEKALAAYNAGEHRVRQWTANGDYSEPAEFVESIPFTETREYVQIVMRNAEIYRRLYGHQLASKAAGQ